MRKSIVAVVFCFAFLVNLPYIVQASPLAYTTERISGQDRIATALSIAQKGWESAQTVILCEYDDYPDSIAAAPFAVSLDAPILLTGGKTLDPRVVSELQRLNPEKVVLLGGQGRLGLAIETELANLSLNWERIGGQTRYETSVLLAGRLNSESLIIVNGDNFPDALSAASYAGMQQIPIVLITKTLPVSVLEYCQQHPPQHVIVTGGESVVPTATLTEAGLTIETRLGGQNRYETNAQIVSYIQDTVQAEDLFLASGLTFADAVAGTVLAAKQKAPLLLTEKEDIPPAVYRILREHMKVEPSSVTAASGKGKVTASGGLNLRDTPSAAGKLLLTIPQGATVDITGAQGNWYQTAYQNKTGWVSADYIEIVLAYKQGKITASGGLNLRESPSTTAEILATIPEGAAVTLTEEGSEWYKAVYRGTSGWIYAEFVSVLPASSGAGPEGIDLSPNGKIYILGGSGVISANTQSIIEGKTASQYTDNLKDFAALPTSLDVCDPLAYDPAREALVDPFQGMPDLALQGKKILIDPGHGGADSGAVGQNNTYEKDNNLAIALYLNDILAEAGAAVILTRETDTAATSKYTTERADLQARVNMADQNKPDLFISIHHNSNPNPDKQGTTTYYSTENPKAAASAKLAEAIQTSLVRTLRTVDDGVRTANYYVLCNTSVPAVLIEVAYISNPYEEARQQNPVFQKNVASAVFQGIYAYFN